jgi:hypothetical protein
VVEASLGKKQDLISKIARGRRAGGMAQAVEYLPRKLSKVLCPVAFLPFLILLTKVCMPNNIKKFKTLPVMVYYLHSVTCSIAMFRSMTAHIYKSSP